MLAILLALAGAISYGVADFIGGVASRRTNALRVMAVNAPAGLVVALVLSLVFGARFSEGALVWGAMAGLASALGSTLLYMALAIGPMAVLATVTAVVNAVVPVLVGVLSGESLSAVSMLGVGLGVVAVPLVAGLNVGERVRLSPKGLALAFGAGVGFAGVFIALDQAPRDSGLAPIVVGYAVNTVVFLGATLCARGRLRAEPWVVVPAAATGVLNASSNALFLFAVHAGELSVTTVIVALYPAATVLLAWLVLRERVAPLQWLGLGLAAGAVGLLALG